MLREGTAVPAVWFSIERFSVCLRSNTAPESRMGFVDFYKTGGEVDLKPDLPRRPRFAARKLV